MRILNTRKDVPTEDDVDMLRRLFQEALKDPDAFIIMKGVTIEVDSDGNIVVKKV
jgi:hypothetical protein